MGNVLQKKKDGKWGGGEQGLRGRREAGLGATKISCSGPELHAQPCVWKKIQKDPNLPSDYQWAQKHSS